MKSAKRCIKVVAPSQPQRTRMRTNCVALIVRLDVRAGDRLMVLGIGGIGGQLPLSRSTAVLVVLAQTLLTKKVAAVVHSKSSSLVVLLLLALVGLRAIPGKTRILVLY